MAGHQVSAASRPQSTLLSDFTLPVGNSGIDDNSSITAKHSMSQSIGNNSSWGGIWAKTNPPAGGAIGSGFGGAGDRRLGPQQPNARTLVAAKGNGFPGPVEDASFSTAAFEGKSSSSALLQGTQEDVDWAKPGLPWAGDSSPAHSNVVATSEGISSPPTRMRVAQHTSPKGLQNGQTSPYYNARPVIAPPTANGGLFDGNAFSDLSGRQNDENSRPQPFGAMSSSSSRGLLGNGTRPQMPNTRTFGAQGEFIPNSRNGNLASQRANSTPPQDDENFNYSQLAQTSQPNMQGQMYSTTGRGMDDLGNRLGKMGLDNGYSAQHQYYGPTSVNQYVTQQQPFAEFYRTNNTFASINQNPQLGWGEQQGYIDASKLSQEYAVENGGFSEYNRVGTMSPREMQQDYGNYQAAYMNGSTPPPSRGPRAMAGMTPMYTRPPSFAGSDFSMYGRVPLGPHYGQPMSPLGPGPTTHPRSKPDDVYHNLRSNLLEEFRSHSKSNKKYELKDIYNHVVEFSGDQHGSRFIQLKLETANSDEKDIIFREIQPNSLQLMTDVFGNYVIQKFFEHGSQLQKTTLAKQMEGHVLTLSRQMYGCRVVQKALEHILMDQQAKLVKELDGHVLACVKDQNGNHVIQKAIERVPAQHIQFIIDAFHGQVHSLATHPYGCRVIQRMLEYCDEDAQISILSELHLCSYTLVQDQYGNYVTQHVIQQGRPEDKAKIVALVTKHLLQFSKHKFASNVVEKSIEYGTEEQRRQIMETITTKVDGTSPLQLLMKDQYGNYVIQKLLQLLVGKDREQLVEQVKPQLQAIKRYSFGKQITAIEKMIYQNGTPQPSGSPNRSIIGSPRSHSSKSSVDSPRSLRSANPSEAPKSAQKDENAVPSV